MQQQVTTQEMLGMLIHTGRIFSSGKGFKEIFSEVMTEVRAITGADGGSLYIYDHDTETLKIVVLTNATLGVDKVVDTFNALKISGFIEVPTRGADGQQNLRIPSVFSYLRNRKVLVASVNDADGEFDFTNTRKFDRENNYKTRNLAVLPLVGHNHDIIGVLQLINCNDDVYSSGMQSFIDAIAGQIGTMLSNALLVNETQELMSAIVEMVGVAIDEKSPHTAGHCQRVCALTMMIADALEADEGGNYRDFRMNEAERRELYISALLHDVGKIITPAHILDKRTKLYTVDDKIAVVHERLRAWQLSRQLSRLEARVRAAGRDELLVDEENNADEEECAFLEAVNRGEVFVDADVQGRLDEIAERHIGASAGRTPPTVIEREELDNLKIARGTLNPDERRIMEDHVAISIRLLSSIPWPGNLRRVVEIAGAHHENMNGTGYPNKLTGADMSLKSRVLGLADRFEGLSAPDRPYRSVKMTLSRVLHIMESMASGGEIDRDLFDFFKGNKLYMRYAEKYLPSELIDCN